MQPFSISLGMTIPHSFNEGLYFFFFFLDTKFHLEFYTSRQLETTTICTILNYLLVLNVHTLIFT